MNVQALSIALTLLRRNFSRKVSAAIGIAALIIGAIFPDHALIADAIAGAMLIDSAVTRKKKNKDVNDTDK